MTSKGVMHMNADPEVIASLVPKPVESPEDWAVRIGLLGDLNGWFEIGSRDPIPASERLLIVLTYEAARRKSWAVLDALVAVVREKAAERDSRVRV